MNISKKVKFGILGCSRVAQKGVMPAMVDSEFAEPFMVGGRDSDGVAEFAAQFGCESWGGYEDVIKNKEVDAVYVSLPHSLHEEWTIKALEAGKHVYVEKPAALTYSSAKRMVGAARKNNVRLIEGLMFRYHPQSVKVREWIKDGALGEILQFDGCFSYAMPERNANAMKKDMGGGSLYGCGVYPIAASRMVFGEEPVSVFSRFKIDKESGVDVEAHMILEYSGGKTAFASSLFGSYYRSTYGVLGTKAHVRMGRAYAVPRDMSTKIFFDTDDTIEEIVVEPADHFKLIIDDFAQEIIKGNKSLKKYEEDLLAQARAVEAVQRSTRENRAVRIEEIQ